MKYIRTDNDEAFRRVLIFSNTPAPFQPFSSRTEVQFNEREEILEIRHWDGSTTLHTVPGGPIVVRYDYVRGRDLIRLTCQQDPANLHRICARIWAKRTDGSGICYKVPSQLPVEGNCAMLLIPGGNREVTLYGDPYFNMVYRLEAGSTH